MLRLPITIHLPILYGKVDVNAMSNEELVEQIKNGYHVTENMQVLYENNLPIWRIAALYCEYQVHTGRK